MSKENRPNDPLDILGVAYETMLERSATEFRKLEKKTGPALHSLIDNAKAKAVELGEITEDEAAHLAEYLKRDLSDAAFYISEQGKEGMCAHASMPCSRILRQSVLRWMPSSRAVLTRSP